MEGMGSEQELWFRRLLRDLCSAQDDVTHNNEHNLPMDDVRAVRSQAIEDVVTRVNLILEIDRITRGGRP